MKKYWIIVASKNHVVEGIKEKIIQICHGKKAPLQKMKKDDEFIYYSGKLMFNEFILYQKFTSIG